MSVEKLREIIEPAADSKASRAFDLMMQARKHQFLFAEHLG